MIMPSNVPKSVSTMIHWALSTVYIIGLTQVAYLVLQAAFEIRLHAIKEYGRVIHEFDPYFNYRATEYLYEHGWTKFATWFDYMVWYPLGRPVGTTIYPGMQVTSVLIKNYILKDWSVNDICVFVPAWFGVIATLMTGLMAYECSVGIHLKPTRTANKQTEKDQDDQTNENENENSNDISDMTANDTDKVQPFGSILNQIPLINVVYSRIIVPVINWLLNLINTLTGSSWGFGTPSPTTTHKVNTTLGSTPALECGVCAAAIMSIIPAHIMRSVGGGYDNESIAMTAMSTTFYCWIRSLRGNTKPNYLWSILTGLAYFYMVAAWGGYVFVLNLIGVHASLLVLLGRYSTKLHRAYTLFYLVGTSLAIQVPVVGWTPLKSLEQLGPLVAFLAFQLIELCQIIKRYKKLNTVQTWKLRIMVFACAGLVALGIGYVLAQTGYFGPISSRVRGLFVKHTKTGNPLVDSVAEHQPATAGAYFQYLHNVCYIAPVGFVLVALFQFHDASSFLLVYGSAAYFFSHKMVRLILLTAPIASVLGGLTLGHFLGYMTGAIFGVTSRPSIATILLMAEDEQHDTTNGSTTANGEQPKEDISVKKKKDTTTTKTKKSKKNSTKKSEEATTTAVATPLLDTTNENKNSDNFVARLLRLAVCVYGIMEGVPYVQEFYKTSQDMAVGMSHPSIIIKGTTRDGRDVTVDDYREAYWWLRDNTPEDSRIMAWWDYGYQITAIANRTTIADGNTWNHEHIALLGRALTSPEKEGHRIARHLADYILLWTGGGGDDLAKSPHMRRIANSVYRHMCPGDPTCRSYGFSQMGPTPTMAASMLYKLHSHKTQTGVEADRNRFRMVYQSRHGKVRIFKVLSVSKESKEWVANPANLDCDAEGSWFCPGHYPPALEKILAEKQDFAQLEDFNRGTAGGDTDYQKQYMENLNNPEKANQAAAREAAEAAAAQRKKKIQKLDAEAIHEINKNWEDSVYTSMMWEIASKNDLPGLRTMLQEEPAVVHMRSADGRGIMWWAHEYGREKLVNILKKLGVSETLKDAKGLTPLDITTL
mmetsp:Transcript_14027/g.19703  ORF Transcript_14027/g.19703 Transcript_14027/m.19703 type:complete len:1048 (-) Transcript_14027:136-3279(-)